MPRELSQWMDSVAKSVDGQFHQACWRPAADIYATRDGILIKLDLPGLSLHEVKISVRPDQVTVSGCRNDHLIDSGLTHQQLEICYSSFVRTVSLQQPVDPESMTCEMENGMLIMRLRNVISQPEKQNG